MTQRSRRQPSVCVPVQTLQQRIGRSLAACLAGLTIWSAGDVGIARERGLVYARRVKERTRDGLPNLQSPVAFIVEWPSGRVILERDADVVRPVASLSKLMAALEVAEACHLPGGKLQVVTANARSAAALQGGNRYSKLRVGWSYSVDDLMHAAMLKSDNKALPALAEACGLDAAGLGRKMTERARAMGLAHTAFAEPDGLSEQNVSTAREFAQVLRAVSANAALKAIMAKTKWTITGHKGVRTETLELKNTDQLVARDVLEATVGKTGFTNLARYCLAAVTNLPKDVASPGATSLGMVFLGAEGRDTRFGDFMRMYKWRTLEATAKSRSLHQDTIKLASVMPAPALEVAAAAPAVGPAGAAGVAAGQPGLADAALAKSPAVPAAAAALPTDEVKPVGLIARLMGLIRSTAGG